MDFNSCMIYFWIHLVWLRYFIYLFFTSELLKLWSFSEELCELQSWSLGTFVDARHWIPVESEQNAAPCGFIVFYSNFWQINKQPFFFFFFKRNNHLMFWSHPFTFVFTRLSDLVLHVFSKATVWKATLLLLLPIHPQPPGFSDPPLLYPSACLAKPLTSQCSSLGDR